ncbi:hypothetical protein MKW98_010335 [Papaver atlanticum]|uniref:Uncharacterized protein n=1 Tax=Papaver atlanticum TaxID=357466 RepID=A0AAD4XGY1_9MAGN|nr:hypothetical protein MKW98_010335 [Papaver atlanticum]
MHLEICPQIEEEQILAHTYVGYSNEYPDFTNSSKTVVSTAYRTFSYLKCLHDQRQCFSVLAARSQLNSDSHQLFQEALTNISIIYVKLKKEDTG